ncbi:unnamed protein product [Cladocopium goreaui]|uniref:Uncharacterized protein n=1 Tax=Cladocopium goreaui TaxID=2562237 RepID=A0A9P1D3I5_9DINO|nr:unnamed protein product [Cladocopium goreaui]
MQICPRWYAIPLNFLSLLVVLYALAAALKFSGAVPDLKERSFVLAVVRLAFLLALPFLFFSVVSSVRCVQRLPADEAAMLLFRYWKDSTDDPGTKELPEKFQGVFWFSTDPSPELCINFQAAAFDAATRTMKLYPGSSYTWVWCDSCVGWAFYLFFAFVNPIYSLQVRWEEGYQKAYLPSILFGCSPPEEDSILTYCWVYKFRIKSWKMFGQSFGTWLFRPPRFHCGINWRW